MDLKQIASPIDSHLQKFDTYFKDEMKSSVPLLDLVIKYLTRKKGKRVRPSLVFLSAEACGGINERTYIGATMVELLHTATLVHDDVVDEANVRRGIASINAAWNNKIAVLIGDYLLSKGLLSATRHREYQFLHITSEAVNLMSEGELLQIQKSKEQEIDESTYLRIISSKTASLMGACTEIGALSSNDSEKVQKNMRDYGVSLGLAFQIRDDIFDFDSKKSIIGKPVGNDLKEKKITLPLLHSVNNINGSERKKIIKMVKSGKISKKEISYVIDFVKSNGGIEYSMIRAGEYRDNAIESLNILPDSVAKESLISLANFVIDRKS